MADSNSNSRNRSSLTSNEEENFGGPSRRLIRWPEKMALGHFPDFSFSDKTHFCNIPYLVQVNVFLPRLCSNKHLLQGVQFKKRQQAVVLRIIKAIKYQMVLPRQLEGPWDRKSLVVNPHYVPSEFFFNRVFFWVPGHTRLIVSAEGDRTLDLQLIWQLGLTINPPLVKSQGRNVC